MGEEEMIEEEGEKADAYPNFRAGTHTFYPVQIFIFVVGGLLSLGFIYGTVRMVIIAITEQEWALILGALFAVSFTTLIWYLLVRGFAYCGNCKRFFTLKRTGYGVVECTFCGNKIIHGED